MADSSRPDSRKRIVILGGGFGGAYAAKTLHKLSKSTPLDVTLIDRNNYLLFYPLLVEAGVGAIEPRHVVVPIRRFMPGGDFRMAEVVSVDLERSVVSLRMIGSDQVEEQPYDHVVLSLGSVTRMAPIPGLAEHAFQLKSLTDAVALRDRGIRLLEQANRVADAQRRRDLLRHVVVGANFTGVEFAGEYHAFLTHAAKDYANVRPEEIEMVLVEYTDRILPAVDPKLSAWAHDTLSRRGVRIVTSATITEATAEGVTLTTGERLATSTLLWAAGIAPNPLIETIRGLPLNERGYIECEPDLRVKGLSNVWAVGDCAAVLSKGRPFAATAQTATRQGPLVAKNVVAAMRGEPTKPFVFEPLGSFAALGRHSAAAEFLGRNITGFLGWFLYRSTYLFKMPTLAMKVRLGADWFLELILPSEPVQLGVHHTRQGR